MAEADHVIIFDNTGRNPHLLAEYRDGRCVRRGVPGLEILL
jgi:predicted ABC-type ATPase